MFRHTPSILVAGVLAAALTVSPHRPGHAQGNPPGATPQLVTPLPSSTPPSPSSSPPSPAASTVVMSETELEGTPMTAPPQPPLYRRPWLWGAIGVVALTGVAILVGISSSGPDVPDTTLGDMRAF